VVYRKRVRAKIVGHFEGATGTAFLGTAAKATAAKATAAAAAAAAAAANEGRYAGFFALVIYSVEKKGDGDEGKEHDHA